MLNTAVIDKGTDTPRTIRWGWWHVERFVDIIAYDLSLPDEFGFWEALSKCPHTVRNEHTFTDPADGEVFTVHPGDRLEAWRDR